MEKELDRANAALTLLKITHKGNRLYFRGTFPSKSGVGKSRYEFASGCVATLEGLKIAKAKALQIESSLMLGSFSWSTLNIKELETVRHFVEQMKTDFFQENKAKNLKTTDYWEIRYNHYLRLLPQDRRLTCGLLRDALKTYAADSSSRKECLRVFKKLCQISNLECDLSDLKSTYSLKSVGPRTLPSDEEIIEGWRKITIPEWQWVYGMMATYGLRNHEVFKLDLEGLKENPPLAIVAEKTKTGPGIVYPFPAEWVDLFNLREPKIPKIKRFDELSNRSIGNRVWGAFNRFVDFNPYQLRHAFAIRMAKIGVPDTVAAKMMRHDLTVHYRVYQRHFSQRDMEEVWRRLNPTDPC